jgi:hypothetical protein
MRLLLGTDEGIFLLEERSAPEAVLTGVLEHPYCRTIALDSAKPERLYTAGASEGPGAWRRPTGAETALFRSDCSRGNRARAPARSWKRLRGGLPESFRPSISVLVTDPHAPDAVAFGTDDGEVCLSRDAGERWERIAQAPPVRRMRTL